MRGTRTRKLLLIIRQHLPSLKVPQTTAGCAFKGNVNINNTKLSNCYKLWEERLEPLWRKV
jgi:hypothetical protein